MKYPEKQVATCPHCGNKTVFQIVNMIVTPEEVEMWPDQIETFEGYNFFSQCGTCSQVVLFYTWEHDENPHLIEHAHTLYPIKKNIPTIVPEKIRTVYDEARKVKKISPTFFGIGVRKALEILCEEQKASGKYLSDKILDLVNKGILPSHLGRMANALRKFGNIGAHDATNNISADEAELLDELYSAIVEYVYVAPSKLAKLSDLYKKRFPAK